MRSLFAAATLGATLAVLGCAPPDAELRRARLEAERRNLESTLDALEDRLLVNQARVRHWKELRARHESVSAVACASLDQHAEDMARHNAPPKGYRVATAGRERPAASRGAAQ